MLILQVQIKKYIHFITGCSYGTPSNENKDYGCQYTYDIEINGTGASTTGTIYGIYDMSGGALDYVMVFYNDILGNTGFKTLPELKYYDKYTSIACNGSECLSHALNEIAGWYNDAIFIPSETSPYLLRGGYYYSNPLGDTGIFSSYFSGYSGGSDPFSSFRIVISS